MTLRLQSTRKVASFASYDLLQLCLYESYSSTTLAVKLLQLYPMGIVILQSYYYGILLFRTLDLVGPQLYTCIIALQPFPIPTHLHIPTFSYENILMWAFMTRLYINSVILSYKIFHNLTIARSMTLLVYNSTIQLQGFGDLDLVGFTLLRVYFPGF